MGPIFTYFCCQPLKTIIFSMLVQIILISGHANKSIFMDTHLFIDLI